MMSRLDHLTVVASNLEIGADYVETALGVRPGTGRKHPGMATHNLLLALGTDVYLEVISADPEAVAVRRRRWFGLDEARPRSRARLAAWVARTDAIAEAASAELGQVESMQRGDHVWQMTVRTDGRPPLDGAAPLLIQRQSNVNPVAALPSTGLKLRQLRIQHPAPSRVTDVFSKIALSSGPSIVVTWGAACSLVAEIQTPFGPREFGGN